MKLNLRTILAPFVGAILLSSSVAFAQEGDADVQPQWSAEAQYEEVDGQYEDVTTSSQIIDSGNADISSEQVQDGIEVANEETAEDSDSPVKGHGLQLAMTFAAVPPGIIDKWFRYHGNTWDDAVNMGVSFDYFLRFRRPCEMRFSMSWVNARTNDAYWLEEARADALHLADYVVQNYSILALEITAYHVVRIIDEIAFYYGGGGWFGAILGDAKGYVIRSSCARAGGDISTCPHEPGAIPFPYMPKVFGFVVATVGFKFTLFDTMTIRAEGGFKGYFYGQLGLGAEF